MTSPYNERMISLLAASANVSKAVSYETGYSYCSRRVTQVRVLVSVSNVLSAYGARIDDVDAACLMSLSRHSKGHTMQ